MSYIAPIKDMLFVMNELGGLAGINALPGLEDATPDTAQAVLEEKAKFVQDVIAPLNRSGDVEPSYWENGHVVTSKGFKEAFKQFGADGWQGVQHPVDFGGQGLPKLIATPCFEMMNAANISFALCPMLTDGAIEALMTVGSEEQKQTYLPHLISGQWTGTMNLTEPQAGSDLAQVRSMATPQPDGTYRISGQKIFITYGEHDMAENIVHLVLARIPGAPEGVKGISLFIVPKFLVNADGSVGKRNDVYCASIEHKLGIKASPTAILIFGDNKGEMGAGAIGSLIGAENRGLEAMFIMMNAARFAVGTQGIGVADRAYQKAVAYAKDRVQSRAVEGSPGPVAIIEHPDVRRMLMRMRSQTEAARALAYVTAASFDRAHHHADAEMRKKNQAFYEFMVPIVKGWCTEMSIDVASDGVQVHGGMGYIEETGAAQYYRDARILTIYEGTTAIQANDLIGRKTVRDGGAVARVLIEHLRADQKNLAQGSADCIEIGQKLGAAAQAMEEVVNFVLANSKTDVRAVFAGSVIYLKLAGITLGGWQMARAAMIAEKHLQANDPDPEFWRAKIATARFFSDHFLSQVPGLSHSIIHGASGTLALSTEQF